MDFPTFAEVRDRVGGVKGVIRLLGDAPLSDHKWKSFPKCPFCGNKDCAGVFERGGADWFKCQHTACSTGGRVVSETGYISLREGLSEDAPPEGGPSPAYKRLLELAGAYVEPPAKEEREAHAAEPQLGTAPQPSPVPTGEGGGLLNPVLPPDVPAPAPEPADDVALIRQAIEMIRQEKKASIRLLQAGLRLGYARALRVMDGLERWGVVGPAVPGEKFRAVLNLPSSSEATKGGPAAAEPSPRSAGTTGETPVEPAGGTPAPQQKLAPAPPPKAAAPEEEAKPEVVPGLTALRWFYDRLTPTASQMQAYLPDGSPVPSPLPSAMMKKLKFRPASLDELRMLSPVTCEALGFRANPRGNEALLLEMRDGFDWEELRASGLWLDADNKRNLPRRPNPQYHGKGQVGKKPMDERRDEDDKWQWGWSEPVLIAYFNEAGELVKLRPHKGGAASGTAAGSDHIYVPRDYRSLRTVTQASDRVEKFYTVIICEGEYKAAVIWEAIGAGAALHGDGRCPVGVCALPGISFAKNPAYRAELDDWLRAVGCQKVIVAFDDEDKSHKPMRQAYDSVIYGRYLATSLNLDLKIPALYLKLPETWRVNGKADWDGGAVKLRDDARAAGGVR